MKRFYVVQWKSTRTVDFMFRDEKSNRRAGWFMLQAECHNGSNLSNPEASVYCFESKEDADELAKTMATSHIGTSWMVCEASQAYRVAPGAMQKMSISERGVLPA
jgi:hypothetical protein